MKTNIHPKGRECSYFPDITEDYLSCKSASYVVYKNYLNERNFLSLHKRFKGVSFRLSKRDPK